MRRIILLALTFLSASASVPSPAATDKPYRYQELACADLFGVLVWLDERLIQPHPAVIEERILEGLRRYDEMHQLGLPRTAQHVLAEQMLLAGNRSKPAIEMINSFMRIYYDPARRADLLATISWDRKDQLFSFSPNQLRFGKLSVEESVRTRVEASAAGRVGAFGAVLQIDADSRQVEVRGNQRLFDILKYDWGMTDVED